MKSIQMKDAKKISWKALRTENSLTSLVSTGLVTHEVSNRCGLPRHMPFFCLFELSRNTWLITIDEAKDNTRIDRGEK